MSKRLPSKIESLGVYQVFTGTGTGSGWLIDDRHLLTNCHVVQPFRDVAIELRNRTRIRATVRRLHPHRDLAIVELSEPLDGAVLPLGDDSLLKPKQSVHILGFPIGLPLSVTEGVISHPHQRFDNQYYVQTDAAINPGNSGGPILDDERRIIAVTTCKLDADSVGFGIPVNDVRKFIEEFRNQTVPFGAQCPVCDVLITKAQRYCDECGSNLESQHDFADYFSSNETDPLATFVETALSRAGIDPVIARHGHQNWSCHAGSAPIKAWCCCSEHLNFSSPMVETPTRQVNALFAYLLDEEHAPFSFDLDGSIVRMNYVIHTTDVFSKRDREHLIEEVGEFIRRADRIDGRLVKEFGCTPAPDSQMPGGHD
ncbi:MAG: serine protease [Ahniella sp.]|nr:serine protease [Ahniella sp.]